MRVEELDTIQISVLGAGGVGGLLAAVLSRVGDRVTVLSEGSSAERLRTGGLHVHSVRFGEFTVAVSVAPELDSDVMSASWPSRRPDLDAALRRVQPGPQGQALVVPLLNGVEHVPVLRERYPEARVVAATFRVESARVAPEEIEQSSPFTPMEMAMLPGPADDLERLRRHLEAAGVEVTIRDDEATVLWAKLAFSGAS